MIFKVKIKESRVLTLMLITGISIALWGTTDSLDAKFYYESQEALEFLQSLSNERRINYFWTEYVDFIFLTAYSLWFFLLANRFYPKNIEIRLFAFVPGIFDFVETITISYLLRLPVIFDVPAWLGVVTALKWTIGTVVSGILFYGYTKTKSAFKEIK